MYCLSTPKRTETSMETGMETARRTLASALGMLSLDASEEGLVAVRWQDDAGGAADRRGTRGAERTLDQTCAWLRAYFAGQRLPPLPPLAPAGTDFQRA